MSRLDEYRKKRVKEKRLEDEGVVADHIWSGKHIDELLEIIAKAEEALREICKPAPKAFMRDIARQTLAELRGEK